MPRIRITRLCKTFRRSGGSTVTPVDNVDLEVGTDEMVVLLGPSGCGKTTLLRCVAGLERPDAGEIEIDGQIVFSAEKSIYLPPDQRRLSMIFQSFALWPHMTVFDNVAYPLESRGTPRPDIPKRVNETLELVGIGNLAAQFPAQISGGQQQRVALARALVGNTSVVLFDEPLSSVDAKVREQLRIELKRMQQKIRFSGLYVTHDQTEAMELGHRVAVLESGRIAALGDPQSVYEHPTSEYVANFVGAANIWRGKVMRCDAAGVLVRTEFGDFLAVVERNLSIETGGFVKVVVRPEKFRLSANAAAEGPNALRVRIETRMFAGPYTEYLVSRGALSARVWVHDEAGAPREGEELMLCVEADKIRLLTGDGA
ncbi:MAG: ABC transporter ATP-binding protein [Betaproteobacteria bacterium]|nr:ABC transporter ATP-binding protein [Betaproteobacteria bacterium]